MDIDNFRRIQESQQEASLNQLILQGKTTGDYSGVTELYQTFCDSPLSSLNEHLLFEESTAKDETWKGIYLKINKKNDEEHFTVYIKISLEQMVSDAKYLSIIDQDNIDKDDLESEIGHRAIATIYPLCKKIWQYAGEWDDFTDEHTLSQYFETYLKRNLRVKQLPVLVENYLTEGICEFVSSLYGHGNGIKRVNDGPASTEAQHDRRRKIFLDLLK